MAKHQRRKVLKMMVHGSALAATSTVTGTAAAAETVSVSGKVVTADGKPAVDVTMEANTNSYPRTTTDAQGHFSLDVASNSQFNLGLYEYKTDSSPPKRDGIPFMYDFGEYSVSDSGVDLGTLELPEAHVVTLRVLDVDGNPVSSAEPDIAAKNGGHWFGAGPSTTYLTEDGYLKLDGAEKMGVELGGPVLLSTKFRDTGAKYEKSFNITEPTNLIVQAGEGFRETDSSTTTTTQTTTATTTSSPTPTTKRTTTESTTTTSLPTTKTTSQPTETAMSQNRTMSADDTEAGSKRGFFSNGESAGNYDLLNNPFFLTVGGFVLSVAGIAHNLLRGR